MTLKSTYHLAEVTGVVCVVSRQADWNEPRYHLCHWPTQIYSFDFCRFFDVAPADIRARFRVLESMPGEYLVTYVNTEGRSGADVRLQLVDGARTKSVLTTYEPVPVPRVGKGTLREWQSGRWRIVPPKGKVRIVEV